MSLHQILYIFNHPEEEKNKADADNNEEENPADQDFAPILGPKKTERKPECVKKLEKVESDFGFVGR